MRISRDTSHIIVILQILGVILCYKDFKVDNLYMTTIISLGLYPLFWLYYLLLIRKKTTKGKCFVLVTALLMILYLGIVINTHFAVFSLKNIDSCNLFLIYIDFYMFISNCVFFFYTYFTFIWISVYLFYLLRGKKEPIPDNLQNLQEPLNSPPPLTLE